MSSTPKSTTIAIDAMGGDFGPQVTVPASLAFLNKPQNVQHKVVLVGLEDEVSPIVEQMGGGKLLKSSRLSIQHASEVVAMDESPALALKRKKDSSMRVSINLVKEGTAQAAVSAGNTGALMATARFVLKTLEGIDRPAIVATMPCLDPTQTLHMLDLGANVDSTPEMLVQFAVMGSVLTKYVDKKEAPRVALLNVGAEEIKGSEKVKKASQLLSESNLNYVGYIEADEILHGKVDVIVCDGFEGNVALKASEGAAKMIMSVLQEEFKRTAYSKFAGLMSKPIFNSIKDRLDPRSHNGATLIGLNGIVIKSHGGTDQYGFLNAIEEGCRQANRDVTSHISNEISEIFSN
jgi:glycerol-3-phosphate acyltransferase PlsX